MSRGRGGRGSVPRKKDPPRPKVVKSRTGNGGQRLRFRTYLRQLSISEGRRWARGEYIRRWCLSLSPILPKSVLYEISFFYIDLYNSCKILLFTLLASPSMLFIFVYTWILSWFYVLRFDCICFPLHLLSCTVNL